MKLPEGIRLSNLFSLGQVIWYSTDSEKLFPYKIIKLKPGKTPGQEKIALMNLLGDARFPWDVDSMTLINWFHLSPEAYKMETKEKLKKEILRCSKRKENLEAKLSKLQETHTPEKLCGPWYQKLLMP